MILTDLILSSRINQRWCYSGLDSPQHCMNRKHFEQYPFTVDYQYNSRGFRDLEWPNDINELQSAIWCIGDSFTVGLGQPFEHIWPQVLSQKSNRRTINISLDGASNDWISRRTLDIISAVNPKNIVVMWTYVERREKIDEYWQQFYKKIRDPTWPDCEFLKDLESLPESIQWEIKNVFDFSPQGIDDCFRCRDAMASDEENFVNWKYCIDSVSTHPQIVHSVVPHFAHKTMNDSLNEQFWTYLLSHTTKQVGQFQNLDMARDYYHFGVLTSHWIVDQILPLLV